MLSAFKYDLDFRIDDKKEEKKKKTRGAGRIQL